MFHRNDRKRGQHRTYKSVNFDKLSKMPVGSVESWLSDKSLYPIRESGQSVDGAFCFITMIVEEGNTGLTGWSSLSGGRMRHPLYSSIQARINTYPTQKKIRHTTRYIRKGEKLLRDWVYNRQIKTG